MKVQSSRLATILVGITLLTFVGSGVSQASSFFKGSTSATAQRSQCLAWLSKVYAYGLSKQTPEEKQSHATLEQFNAIIAKMPTADCLKTQSNDAGAKLQVVVDDATAIGKEIKNILTPYSSLGSSNASNSITLTLKDKVQYLVFGKMVKASGKGLATSNGPLLQVAPYPLSAGSSLSSASYASGVKKLFCLVVSSTDKITGVKYYAKYSDKGLVKKQTGGSALTCRNGI